MASARRLHSFDRNLGRRRRTWFPAAMIVSCMYGILEFQARVDTLVGHDHFVMQVKVHPHDASLVATASLDRTIKIWNLDLQERHSCCRSSLVGQQHPLVGTLEGHERGVNCLDFLPVAAASTTAAVDCRDDASSSEQYSPYLVSGSDDCTIRVWNYQTLELLHTFCKMCTCTILMPSCSTRHSLASCRHPKMGKSSCGTCQSGNHTNFFSWDGICLEYGQG